MSVCANLVVTPVFHFQIFMLRCNEIASETAKAIYNLVSSFTRFFTKALVQRCRVYKSKYKFIKKNNKASSH